MTALAAVISLCASCSMEDGLNNSKKEAVGYVDASMVPSSTEPMLTRAASEQYDVNDFAVAIVNTASGDTVSRYASYSAMKAEGQIALNAGSYRVVAWMGTNESEVQTSPYFEGSTDFEVVAKRTSQVQTVCKLARVKVSVEVSDEFEQAFEDDYSLTFTGSRGVETMTAATKHLSYYFKAYEGDKKIAVEVKATPKGETYTLTKKFELTKSGESDTDGGLLDLEHGDAFKINLSPSNTSDGTVANPTESNFNITAELKWNNRSEEVEIPIDVVDTSAPSTDEDKDDDADAENGPVLTPSINDVNTWELDLTDGEFATILVNIQAPATIQKLIVNISSDNEDFASTVKEGMNMGEFDLCNITDPTTEENVVSLEMPYNDDIKGLSQFTFDISGFSGALTLFEGTHYFTITVEDGNGERSSGTLTVRVTL
jgi:hypothetical protein